MELTIGGDRLGSGKKQKQELSSYSRSSFNQEQDWKSSMAPGLLYPFLCIPMTNGDSIDIDLDAFVRTLPTKGPLFGSFKLQADLFSIPMRLYNGVLHNNPTRIGMKMNQIFMPKLNLKYTGSRVDGYESLQETWNRGKMNESSLMKYLGMSGIGRIVPTALQRQFQYIRAINAIPALGYYDIFKTYYSNKQEEKAYIIGVNETESKTINVTKISLYNGINYVRDYEPENNIPLQPTISWRTQTIEIFYENPITKEEFLQQEIMLGQENETSYELFIKELPKENFEILNESNEEQDVWKIKITNPVTIQGTTCNFIFIYDSITTIAATQQMQLLPFNLDNIDEMRKEILRATEIGYQFRIDSDNDEADWHNGSGTDQTGLPYTALTRITSDNKPWNTFPLNGLVCKTYQNDLFNNWIDTEWIEGENGISALSAIDVSEGTLQMDSLNLAQKVYDMFNRIAISGGTYEDWQEVVFAEGAVRKAESPIYEGGMSAEVAFEEVISNAETMVDGDFQALGSLGGKGTMLNQNGGHEIHIKAREPIFVMGIVSLTPRICYTQGNEWYLTDLDSFDDLHKPALDGIGFQDLIGEQMDWRDTILTRDSGGAQNITRHSPGKVVAWSNYMTAVDKAYGDFAREEGKNFMVLSRNYSFDGTEVTDFTTYIDPAKYNYAFAYTNLEAQNFWVQVHSKIVTRRVMSAHQIPNL